MAYGSRASKTDVLELIPAHLLFDETFYRYVTQQNERMVKLQTQTILHLEKLHLDSRVGHQSIVSWFIFIFAPAITRTWNARHSQERHSRTSTTSRATVIIVGLTDINKTLLINKVSSQLDIIVCSSLVWDLVILTGTGTTLRKQKVSFIQHGLVTFFDFLRAVANGVLSSACSVEGSVSLCLSSFSSDDAFRFCPVFPRDFLTTSADNKCNGYSRSHLLAPTVQLHPDIYI